MTDAEFQTIADQVAELEASLMEWDCRGDAATVRLGWLRDIFVLPFPLTFC